MSATLLTPLDLVESIADMRFPEKTNQRLQLLMDRNNEGQLQPHEREELESLAELSESMSLLRARAMHTLGRKP